MREGEKERKEMIVLPPCLPRPRGVLVLSWPIIFTCYNRLFLFLPSLVPAGGSWDLKFLFFLCAVSSDNLTPQIKDKEDTQEMPCTSSDPVPGNLDLNYSALPWGFAGGLDSKESACDARDPCSWGQEDPLEKGMATHSNILVWRSHVISAYTVT